MSKSTVLCSTRTYRSRLFPRRPYSLVRHPTYSSSPPLRYTNPYSPTTQSNHPSPRPHDIVILISVLPHCPSRPPPDLLSSNPAEQITATCTPELTALLSCFATSADLRATDACAAAATNLHKCMSTAPVGRPRKRVSSVSHDGSLFVIGKLHLVSATPIPSFLVRCAGT